MSFEEVAKSRSFGGRQLILKHRSQETGSDMRLSLYLPPAAETAGAGKLPLLIWLSGLTCTEENFTVKAGAQRAAAAHGIAIAAPDTSPRGEGVADDPAYDLGQGAGFYVDATEPPWKPHFRMESYVVSELLSGLLAGWPFDPARVGIFGHSMGGHGALTLALRHPEKFRSLSAFAPIVAPADVPWGHKALGAYLGADETAWHAHDACRLMAARGWPHGPILVDQGDADGFLEEQLQPQRFAEACAAAGVELQLRMQAGYDHSYYFMASFIDEHIAFHAGQLGA